jgi:hypothetical protein
MTAVTATVEVSRPAADVYDYATDPTRFHEWQKGVIDAHLEAALDAKVGDHCVTVRRIGFANRADHLEDHPRRGTASLEHPWHRRTDTRRGRGDRRSRHR